VGKHTVRMSVLVTAIAAGLLIGASAEAGPSTTTVGVGASFVIEPPMARYVAELDPRELSEQVRDWAVLATVARLGANPEAAAAATYELPPARLPYLDEFYAFEYGRGRRAYLGSRVLLFRDADDPDPQATIGRLSDRVREESGAVPANVEIYLVHDERDDGTIRVERAADVKGPELFSPLYGYVEARAGSIAELDAWLAKVDDLTFAQLRDSHLVVGGRRFAKTRTANVTAEDVAALYQAHIALGAAHAVGRATIQASSVAEDRFTRAIGLASAGMHKEALALWQQPLAHAWASRERGRDLVEPIANATPVRGPGFSLDPEWIPDPAAPAQPLMLTRMRAFASDPCGELEAIAKHATNRERVEPDPASYVSPTRRALRVREARNEALEHLGEASMCRALKAFAPELDKTVSTIADAVGAGWDQALAGYHQLRRELIAVPGDDRRAVAAYLTLPVLAYYAAETRTQCARYEGTRGTGVGMTMFYTDLLAKLWIGVDHGLSAPTIDVPGFRTLPRIDPGSSYSETNQQNRATRLWFGPRANGVSRADGRRIAIMFDHSFARIYAAGNDPGRPGIEARPNEPSRLAIGWWDRHYDEIADYEQEFHRLNQIMKWSLVTGALSKANAASYLRKVSVSQDLDFDQWLRDNRTRLRFAGSIPDTRRDASGKSCLPIFESYQMGSYQGSISGGVSAATSESLLRVPAVNLAKPLGARKPPAANLIDDTAGTAVRVAPRRAGDAVVFDNAEGVPTRQAGQDIVLGTPRIAFKAGTKPGAIEVHAGDPQRSIGVVSAERTDSNVRMRWRDGVVEQERHVPSSAAKSFGEADDLARAGDIQGAAEAFEAAAPEVVPGSTLARARDLVVQSAHRRPRPVLNELTRLVDSGAELSSGVQEMLVRATAGVGTPSAGLHVKNALAKRLPLNGPGGRLMVDRGTIVLTRDVAQLETKATKIPPATDLAERAIYMDHRLRVGQEGVLPDLGGPAARWQHRPNVRISELRKNPAGLPPDEIVETSTSARFDYIAPRTLETSSPYPPLVIRQCDARHETPRTDDDC
jgi:hypothetical protein